MTDNKAQIRSPICSVMGHVDHGKSSILDKIRGSTVTKGEAGGITQAIGASIIPLKVIQKVCDKCLSGVEQNYSIPGLLFIDTPGHAAFTTLRKRGGNLADIAILVVDLNEGFKPQTIEALEILKSYKTPFIVAANKVDLVSGWSSDPNIPLTQNLAKQSPNTIQTIETKMYELVGKLAEYGLNSERFDRIEDYTKQIGIMPVSAMTGEGIPELLMILSGLAQKFLENSLECDVEGRAKGTILEVKEEKGLGTTIDVILYDGKLKRNDTIVIGSMNEPIVTKVRALLEPSHLCDMMDKKAKYCNINEVYSATGVKIAAPNLDNVVAGMPLISAPQEKLEEVKALIQEQLDEVIIETDEEGIIIKADTLGSVEALIKLFKEKEVNIRKATVGNITKRDINDAQTNYEKDPLTSVIIGFNVKDESGIKQDTVKIFSSNIIYRLIEDFEKWHKEELENMESRGLDKVVRPCKFQLLEGYCFRQSNPAIGGAEIMVGIMKNGMPIMKNGKHIATVKGIQHEKESVKKLEKGKQAAVSMDNVTFGRQIEEGDILYSYIPEEDFKKLKELKKHLSKEEIQVLKDVAEMMRENNPVWGI